MLQTSELLPALIQLVESAAAIILPIYHSQDESLLELKSDGSPLTQADVASHNLIVEGLKKLTPDIPVISEEASNVGYAERQAWQRYWLIDPIDGTKEFLAKNGDFTVNIALIESNQPIIGVVGVPVSGDVYYAMRGEVAWKKTKDGIAREIFSRKVQLDQPIRIIASRRHGEDAAEKIRQHFPLIELMRRGSSLKFCLLAEGKADLYPRLGFTSEWDTAAAQCILEAAGGNVVDLFGVALKYNSQDSFRNPYFIASGDASIAWYKYFTPA